MHTITGNEIRIVVPLILGMSLTACGTTNVTGNPGQVIITERQEATNQNQELESVKGVDATGGQDEDGDSGTASDIERTLGTFVGLACSS